MRVRLAAAALLCLVCCSSSLALSAQLTTSQRKVCERANETRRCLTLLHEFAGKGFTSPAGPQGDLAYPEHFPDQMAARVALRAFIRAQTPAVKGLLEQDAEAAVESLGQSLATQAATTQVGSASGSSGSTNLTSKPTTTDFLSLAAESGAFTDTLNGTTATLQANALGLTKYFSNVPVFRRWDHAYADALQPFNVSATLNISQSNSGDVATTGSANTATPVSLATVLLPANNASLAGVGATYTFYRPYNPQSKDFQKAWQAAVLADATKLATAGSAIAASVNTLSALPEVNTCFDTARTRWTQPAGPLAIAEGKSFTDFVQQYSLFDQEVAECFVSSAEAAKNTVALSTGLQAFAAERNSILNSVRGTLATVGYTYSTPVQKPSSHDFTAVGSYVFKGTLAPGATKGTFLTGAQITGNFAASLFATVPAGATYGRLRDVQMSAEFDKPFGGTVEARRGTWSLAGYGQYQYDPTVLNITAGNVAPGTNIALPSNAQVLLGTAGWLGVFQAKVVLNLSKGLTIPVAIKWSNKTDLVQGNDVRGQFGLSYDLSALSSLITGGR